MINDVKKYNPNDVLRKNNQPILATRANQIMCVSFINLSLGQFLQALYLDAAISFEQKGLNLLNKKDSLSVVPAEQPRVSRGDHLRRRRLSANDVVLQREHRRSGGYTRRHAAIWPDVPVEHHGHQCLRFGGDVHSHDGLPYRGARHARPRSVDSNCRG